MRKVKKGDGVTVDYEGTLQDGQVFETTADVGPLEFEVGNNMVLPAFEETVIGMAVGETRTLQLTSEQAYGPRRDELVQSFDRTSFGEEINPRPGMVLGMTIEREGQSQKVPGLVTEANDDRVTIDFNHPLAGQSLTFQITLKEITEPTAGDGCQPAPGGGCPPAGCSGCH